MKRFYPFAWIFFPPFGEIVMFTQIGKTYNFLTSDLVKILFVLLSVRFLLFNILYSVFKDHWWAQVDSNHRPRAYQARALTTWAMSPFSFSRCLSFSLALLFARFFELVEMMGFEPMTPCLQGRCSPNWATPPCGSEEWIVNSEKWRVSVEKLRFSSLFIPFEFPFRVTQNWTTTDRH